MPCDTGTHDEKLASKRGPLDYERGVPKGTWAQEPEYIENKDVIQLLWRVFALCQLRGRRSPRLLYFSNLAVIIFKVDLDWLLSVIFLPWSSLLLFLTMLGTNCTFSPRSFFTEIQVRHAQPLITAASAFRIDAPAAPIIVL